VKIEEVIRTVNQMKADGVITNYAIGGAVGATFYLEPVSTLDVDIFVEVHTEPGSSIISLDPIFSYLRERGCKMEGEYVVLTGWPVQFLPPTGPLIEEALASAVEVDVQGIPARVFTAEHLGAIALQTGRAKDKARLLQFIEARALDSSKFEKLMQRHQLTDRWRQFQQQFLSDV
jgi:hypothetical protein